jgi:hypothetical protein
LHGKSFCVAAVADRGNSNAVMKSALRTARV